MKILIAGAWLGEFGYELCKWVPYVRYLAWEGDYEHVVVVCKPGHEYLYIDFADKFYNKDTKRKISEWMVDGKDPKISQQMIKLILEGFKEKVDYDMVQPDINIRDNKDKIFHLMYGRDKLEIEGYDILIHARATTNYNTGYRNWPKSRWMKIVKKYPEYKFASIGSKSGAFHITGTDDKRGIPLKNLAMHMKKAKMLLSPSSGTAHFASLCGLPHVIWTDDKRHGVIGGYTNKQRYRQLWNPFNTFVSVIETSWQPRVDEVEERIKQVLARKKTIIITRPPAPTIRRREINHSPAVCMVTYERQSTFKKTIESLEKSHISLKNFYIFDDFSKNPYKTGYLRTLRKRYHVVQHNQNLGVFVNSLIAIDMCYSVSQDNHIVYCQDDLEFSKNWYSRALKIVDQLNRDGVDWGILALLHFRGGTEKDYYLMKGGHPGGACWIINRKMWQEYREDNIIYNTEQIGDRIIDHKICHWCHHNEKRIWAVAFTGKSLVRHTGVKSNFHTKDMTEYQGLGYGD